MKISEFILRHPHPRNTNSSVLHLQTIMKYLWLRIYARVYRESEFFAPEKLKSIQETRIMQLIERARKIPFYRKHLKNVATVADFYKLPALGKHEMRESLEANEITNPNLAAYQHPRSTSGSSGIPFRFFHDKNMYIRRIALYHRLLRWAGYQKDDIAVWIMREMHPEFGAIPFVCFGPEDIDKRKDELYALFEGKKVVLHAMTSHLIFVADMLEKDRKKFDFRAIISYAEPLHINIRKYLEEKFSAPIFDNYGSQEILNPANECEYHDGFHINSEWTLLEVLDKESRPVPPGKTGIIALTAFDNEYMPFIRYKNGDLGYIMEDNCPCGRTLPRVKIAGRDVHYFIHPNGSVGDFISLVLPLLKQTPKILEFQVERHSRLSFTIRIVPTNLFNKSSKDMVITETKAYLGSKTDVRFEIIDEIPLGPGGKPRVFINKENDLPALTG